VRVPAVHHQGDNPQLVTLTEVAELTGVRRPSVSNWRRRSADFPQPFRDDGQQPLFDAEKLTEWLDRRPIPGARAQPLTYGDRFRDGLRTRTLTGLRGLLPGDASFAAAMALCALRHVTGKSLTDADSVKFLAREAERDQPQLAGALTPDLEQLNADNAALITTIEEMCGTIGAAKAAERLVAEADRLGSGIRVHLTPPRVAEFVSELVGDVTDRVIYDPAAGGGTLLLQVGQGGAPARLLAADRDPAILRMLRQRFACHDTAVQCTVQDSLRAAGWPGVDLVIVDPPFAGSDMTIIDKRRQAARQLFPWLGQAVGQLVPGGQAVVLAPAWLLTRTGDEDPVARLRDSLVKQKILRAVIQLPRLSHPFRTGTELVVLVLTKSIPGEAASTVLVCCAERARQDGMKIADAVRQTLAGGGASLPSDVADEIPRAETNRQRSLLPAHVLSAGLASSGYAGQIAVALRRLDRMRAHEQTRFPDVAELDAPRRLTTIGEHMSEGRLRVFSGFRVPATEIGSGGEVCVIGEPELTGRATIGERRIHYGTLAEIRRVKQTLRSDLVILPVAPMRVLVDTVGGSLVQSPAQVLRILPKKGDGSYGDIPPNLWITPVILAALLTASRNKGRTSGSRVLRDDLGAMELPELSPHEVEQLDHALRELAALRQQAAERLAALDELSEALRSGVADGILAVANDRPVSPDAGRGQGGTT
jgi:predicted DNA-binding transcriptional regulator AlpA